MVFTAFNMVVLIDYPGRKETATEASYDRISELGRSCVATDDSCTEILCNFRKASRAWHFTHLKET